jgi:hypothetical protein
VFAPPKTKKADVAEHPEVLHHVGLLIDGPPGLAGLPFSESSDSQKRASSVSYRAKREKQTDWIARFVTEVAIGRDAAESA